MMQGVKAWTSWAISKKEMAMPDFDGLDRATRTELEAAAFRRLLAHLRERKDVQNIDIMNLAGFCRNCLSNWIVDAATEKNIALEKEDVRSSVYGMSYAEWKEKYQK